MSINQNKGKYAFFLGNNPNLSKAEIKSVLELFSVEYEEIYSTSSVFLIDVLNEIKVNTLQDRLGGTIKIAKIIHSVSKPSIESEIFKLAEEKCGDEKFRFGFSLYDISRNNDFKKIGLNIKRQLKDNGAKVRFITSKDTKLSSVIVKKEKLIDSGLDVVIINDNDNYYLGYSITVQDFSGYSDRDYGRPSRDDKSGMLPPKLAKMMINLSGTSLDKIILDPFCGSGTIIQEALLLGFNNIKGSDISDRAVRDTENNISCLETKFHLDISNVEIKKQDVKSLTKSFNDNSIDSIITEPYLGPPHRTTKNVTSELSNLYLDSFKEFHKVLKENGIVIFILPIIDNKESNILEDIENLGFKRISSSDTERGSLIYSRETQRVKREIFKFEKI